MTSSPLTLATVRRSLRTGVESTRCAAEIAAHPAATRIASTRIVPVCAKYAVSAGNAIGLVLAVALLGYLVYALLAPERLG